MHFALGSQKSQTGRVGVVMFAAAAFASIPFQSLLAATTTPVTAVHAAKSYGAEVNVGSTVKLGPVAVADFPSCYTQNTGSVSASAASISKAGLLTTGVVTSTAASGTNSSTSTSDVVGINLLGGVISGSEIKAVSTSSFTGTKTFSTSAAGTEFGDLKVLGIPVGVNVAPNTVIDLPLIGSVTLNEQITYSSSDEAKLTVNMIHVKINLGASAGTEIIVSSAFSDIKTVKGPAVVGGYAYSPKLTTGSVTVGPLVEEIIPCYGTSGAVETDSVAGTSIPGVLSTGTVTVTGEGNITTAETSSQATSSVAGVNLLAGLVSASAITSSATATTTDGVNFDFSGTNTFLGLSVLGHPEITVDVAPNTKISIANLGTLYFNRVQPGTDHIRVVPIELIVNETNVLGLAVGADLTIGATEAQLHTAAIP